MSAPPDAPPAAAPPAYKNPFVIAFVIGAVVLTALPFLQRGVLSAPAPIASLGEWRLTDEFGQPFGSADLRGRVWIASFFFSRCPTVCPKQQEDFGKILSHLDDIGQGAGQKPVMLVSFTVDPSYDFPEVLNAYARKRNAPRDRWKFLSGSEAQLQELLIKRMRVEMGAPRPIEGTDLIDISHANKFALIDQNGDVRGFWGTDELARGNLINAARMLATRGANP